MKLMSMFASQSYQSYQSGARNHLTSCAVPYDIPKSARLLRRRASMHQLRYKWHARQENAPIPIVIIYDHSSNILQVMSSATDIDRAALPTLERLGVSAPPEVDAAAVAQTWFATFANYVQTNDVDGILAQLVDDAFWRDILTLTWDFRTFFGNDRIRQFLVDRLAATQLSKLELDTQSVALGRPYPDIAWIQASFTFSTAAGTGTGILRLVPTPNGVWKAHTIFTTLEGLRGFPELSGPLREHESKHGTWPEQRRRESACEEPDQQPVVIIVGGGQSGLELAARLKYLGIKTLVVEREARIGQLWRKRYEALCLHDTVCTSVQFKFFCGSPLTIPDRVRPHAIPTVSIARPAKHLSLSTWGRK
jgi:hypothetical protein